MYQDKDSSGVYRSFGFKAPAGASAEKNEVLFPFHSVLTPDYAATIAIEVKQMNTIIRPATLTGALTLNLTINSQLSVGAKLHLVLTSDNNSAGRAVTIGTGFDALAADITVTTSATFFRTYTFDGTAFIPTYQ